MDPCCLELTAEMFRGCVSLDAAACSPVICVFVMFGRVQTERSDLAEQSWVCMQKSHSRETQTLRQ